MVRRTDPAARPRARAAARFTIAGSKPPPDVTALAGDAVGVRANVSEAELHELYRTARVAAVPLRYGAGVKLKVIEALREGLPLVTTSIGAQGVPGLEHVASICDEPLGFRRCRLPAADRRCCLAGSIGRAGDMPPRMIRGGVRRQPRAGTGSVGQSLCGTARLVAGARGVHLAAAQKPPALPTSHQCSAGRGGYAADRCGVPPRWFARR